MSHASLTKVAGMSPCSHLFGSAPAIRHHAAANLRGTAASIRPTAAPARSSRRRLAATGGSAGALEVTVAPLLPPSVELGDGKPSAVPDAGGIQLSARELADNGERSATTATNWQPARFKLLCPYLLADAVPNACLWPLPCLLPPSLCRLQLHAAHQAHRHHRPRLRQP